VLALVCALLLAQAPGPEPLRVAEISFEGADAESVRSLVEVQPGQPLDTRDVRDAIRALHASARFSRVAAYAEPMGEGRVRLVFVLTPVEKLVSVTFPGRDALPESVLLQNANLQVNAEFQPEQVGPAVEALRAVYFRIGYRHAQITPVRRQAPGGVALELRIAEGEATRISEIRFAGDPGLSRDELLAAFRLSPGDVLHVPALDEAVRRVRERYRRAGRLRARVEPAVVEELGKGRARVVVPVEAGPLVRFHLRGNRAFPDSILASQLVFDSEEPLDAQAAQELAGRLRRFYVAAGFLRARISERGMVARDAAEEVVFTIDEGPQVRVERLIFTGNRGIPTAQLRERVLLLLRDNIAPDPASRADPANVERMGVMGTVRGAHASRPRVDPDTVFDPVLYARALKQIEDLYKSQGYLSVRAGPPKLEPIAGNPARLEVTIPIREGEQTLVRRIAVEGGLDVSSKELDGAIVLRSGRPFSYLQAEEGRAALTQIFMRRGHLYARVEDEEEFDDVGDGTARVDVRYRIQPGPVVRVGFVEVVGQRRTVEGLVLDLVGLHRGDVLTPEAIDRGQQALLRTGLFFSATLTPRNPEVPEGEKTVQVQLRERPTREFQAGVGFSLADGPRATAQWTQGNILGRNLTFSAVVKADFPFTRFPTEAICPIDGKPPGSSTACTDVSQFQSHIKYPDGIPIERVIDLGVSAPRLYPLTNALRAGIDLIHERDIRPSYDLTKFSAQLSTGLTRRRPLTADVSYEFGYQELTVGVRSIEDVLAGIDQRIFRLPPGRMLFGSLRPSVLLDLRDDAAHPRSGVLMQISGDYLRSFYGSESSTDVTSDNGPPRVHVNLLKLQAIAAGYIPLPALSSIVLSIRGGRVYQLDNTSLTPGDRRFYLGGSTSLRGFHEDAVQPQDLVDQLRTLVRVCEATLSDLGCTPKAQLLAAGGTSDGGDVFLAMTAELRLPLTPSFETALFWDAGNLWRSAPYRFFQTLVLRHAVGGGLRWLTPIGRMAIDIGINVEPDQLLGEPRLGPYFSIGSI
jgi:outer membrane protein assembly factor BamA